MSKDAIVTVDIANGAALSAEVYLGTRTLVGIEMPADWTAANLTLQAAVETGGTFNNVYDKGGNEYTITAAADRYIVINPDDLFGLARYIKVRSGTGATPVNQGGDRTLKLMLREINPDF